MTVKHNTSGYTLVTFPPATLGNLLTAEMKFPRGVNGDLMTVD